MISSPAKQRMQQILASIGTKQGKAPKIEASDYNWRQLHYFSVSQFKKIDVITKNIAEECAGKLSQLFNDDINVSISSTTQHYACEFGSDSKIAYYLNVSIENQPFGLIAVPYKTAVNWTSQLLGGSDAQQEADKDLSQLEQSLLLDITTGLIASLSKAFERNDLVAAKEISNNQLPLDLQGTEEFCKITFETRKQNSENSFQAFFLIFCEKFEQIIGKNKQAAKNASAKDISKIMLDHVQKIPVSVTAKFASTVLTLEDILNLQIGDVLLLDKKVDEPIELLVRGKPVFRGTPATSAGKYAAIITETIN